MMKRIRMITIVRVRLFEMMIMMTMIMMIMTHIVKLTDICSYRFVSLEKIDHKS